MKNNKKIKDIVLLEKFDEITEDGTHIISFKIYFDENTKEVDNHIFTILY